MCLIFIALHAHPDYPLIIAANRDEFYARPSKHALFWHTHPQLLAGHDLQAGGTWLGVTRTGRFSAITNFRHKDKKTYQKSRGEIVYNFLSSNDSIETYTNKLQHSYSQYAGYNCLFGHLSATPALHYLANHSEQSIPLASGVYGLSNASLDTPWFKVLKGKAAIQNLLQHPFTAEAWFEMLYDEEKAGDNELPSTGIDRQTEKLLSSRFIQSEDYGTRSSTLITVDRHHTITFIERNFCCDGSIEETRLFQFQHSQ